MDRKRVFLILTAACFASAADATGPAFPNNGFYFELFGNGGLLSVNYERRLGQPLGIRIGFAQWSGGSAWTDSETDIWTVPVMLNTLHGTRQHYLELGAGLLFGEIEESATFLSPGRSSSFRSLTATLGYRFQRDPRGFMFRVGFTPFYGLDDESDAYPERGFFASGGMSFGFAF